MEPAQTVRYGGTGCERVTDRGLLISPLSTGVSSDKRASSFLNWHLTLTDNGDGLELRYKLGAVLERSVLDLASSCIRW